MTTLFFQYIDTVTEKIRKNLARITVLHHNDADGLTSGSIVTQALTRLGKDLHRYCLEKPYPLVLERILSEQGGPIIFVDFGSGMTKTLSRLNTHKREIFILDHHAIEAKDVENICIVNPILFEINGSLECSASSVAYFFAASLNPANSDLIALAAIGGIGDGHFGKTKEPKGVHSQVFEDGQKLGVIRKEKNGEIFVKSGSEWNESSKIVDALNSLGSFGYFKGGTDSALKGLEEGFDDRYFSLANKFRDDFEALYQSIKPSLDLNKIGKIVWFDLKDTLKDVGVKSVGLICERLLESGEIDENCVVVGFQHIPESVPGIGKIIFDESKLSVRLGEKISSAANTQERYRVSTFLPSAVLELGGFVDACHRHAGAATIKIGKERALIEALSSIL